MVKKKTTEEAPVETLAQDDTSVLAQDTPEVVQEIVDKESAEASQPAATNGDSPVADIEDVDKKEGHDQDEVPEYVLNYFKRHTHEKAAYFDKLGGVFSTNTQTVFLKDAKLYHNPFFKQ